LSLDDLWEKLKNTKMHEMDFPDAIFSLTVLLKPYSSNVFSVWIYIAVIKDVHE
jgi:hypothetical protein